MKKLIFLLIFLMIGCSNFENKNEYDNYKFDENEKTEEYVKSMGDTLFYIHKLKDEDYTSTYGDGQNIKTWYTAAEELGQIGKPAIPYLIKNLETNCDYERTLTLYALLLSSQHQNVKEFTNGEYIKVNLDFDTKNHEEYIEITHTWWKKYKHNWN